MLTKNNVTIGIKWRFEVGGTLLHKEVKRLRVGVGKCVDTDFWLRCPEHTESELG